VIHSDDPRPFGYVLGDLIERHVQLFAPAPATLTALPRPGRVDQWLALQDVRTRTQRRRDGTEYQIDLVYQLVNSPPAMKHLSLPALALRLSGPGSSLAELPPVAFTASPIAPADASPGELRPDRRAVPLPTGPIVVRLVAYGLAIALLVLMLLHRLVLVPYLLRRNGPFARACRTLRLLQGVAPSAERQQRALRAVHRAFDQSLGATAFPERLETLFGRDAHLEALRADTTLFFEYSRREFFDAGAGAQPTLEWLAGFCARWRAVERA
jgi:mxaA protein